MEHARPMLRRCAIYTRKSSEEGLEQNFNSLHAQRDAKSNPQRCALIQLSNLDLVGFRLLPAAICKT
jgi:hypothetical protein